MTLTYIGIDRLSEVSKKVMFNDIRVALQSNTTLAAIHAQGVMHTRTSTAINWRTANCKLQRAGLYCCRQRSNCS